MTVSYAVTGAAGCIGRAFLEYFKEIEGGSVLGIDLAPKPISFPNVKWVEGDILNPASYSNQLAGVQTVIHLAAKAHSIPASQLEADEIWRINFEGTEKVIDAAFRAGVRKFLFVSTVAVLSSRRGHLSDAYADSKRAAEETVLRFSDRMCVVIARPTTVYGPYDRGNILKLIRWIDRRLSPIIGDGKNRKSLVFTRNLAAALAFVAKRGKENEVYAVTDGQDFSMNEIVEVIGKFLGRKNLWPAIPFEIAEGMATANEWLWREFGAPKIITRDVVEKLNEESVFDATPLFSLGFSPHHKFQDAMAETIQWYKDSVQSRSL